MLPGSWVPIPSPQKHPAVLNWWVGGSWVWEKEGRCGGGQGRRGGQERRGAHSQNKAPLYSSHPPPAPHGSSLSPPLSPLQPSDTPAQANYQALCSSTDLLVLMCELAGSHALARSRTHARTHSHALARSVRNNAYRNCFPPVPLAHARGNFSLWRSS